jgi:hypothetical protein
LLKSKNSQPFGNKNHTTGANMEMKRINAGKLRAIGYDARTRVLRVELDDGSAIDYAAVGQDVWQRLANSGAAWSFYRDNIEDEFTGRRGVAGKQARPAALDDLFKTPEAES